MSIIVINGKENKEKAKKIIKKEYSKTVIDINKRAEENDKLMRELEEIIFGKDDSKDEQPEDTSFESGIAKEEYESEAKDIEGEFRNMRIPSFRVLEYTNSDELKHLLNEAPEAKKMICDFYSLLLILSIATEGETSLFISGVEEALNNMFKDKDVGVEIKISEVD